MGIRPVGSDHPDGTLVGWFLRIGRLHLHRVAPLAIVGQANHPEDDPLAARRVPPARHVEDEFRVDEADDVRAVGVHHVKVGRARAVGDERDPFPIGRPARISVFRVWAALKVAGVARVGVDREDFRVAGPHCGDEEGLAGEAAREAGTGQDDRQHNKAVDLKMMFPFGNR